MGPAAFGFYYDAGLLKVEDVVDNINCVAIFAF